MGLKVLIAEAHEVLRVGLRAIFAEDTRVSDVYEVANEKELRAKIQQYRFDLIVINQSLLHSENSLPARNFVVLAAEPDIALLKAAYRSGACGYLSVNVSAELLLTMLRPREDAFLVEPALVPHIMEHIFEKDSSAVNEELLTPREKEIISLLRNGLDKPSIARKLSIAETTLKTHMKNISKKRTLRAYKRNNC